MIPSSEDVVTKLGIWIKNSHFVYSSGRHGRSYFDKDALYPHTRETSLLCLALAEKFEAYGAQAVIGPAKGGIILAQWVAHHLTMMSSKEVLAVYIEKSADKKSFDIRRGYNPLVSGKKVLVVEDVLNTGGSAKRVVEAVWRSNGNVVGLGALCNRGEVKPADVANVPVIISLIEETEESWPEANCPLCAAGVAINTAVGHGQEFLVHQQGGTSTE